MALDPYLILETFGTAFGHQTGMALDPYLINLGDLWRRFGHQRSMALDTWDASGAPKLRRAYVMLAKFVAYEGCRSGKRRG